MKGILGILALMLCVSGCMGPYDTPVFVNIGNSETPFLIQLEGDSKQATQVTEELLKKSMIGSRRVQISYRWIKTDRGMDWNGKYVPNEQLIVVDRAPVTREWTAETHSGTSTANQAIWVESKDSVNFSTGIAITARVKDDADALKFLFNYPAGKEQPAMTEKIKYKDPYMVKCVNLELVMDQEIRARVQKLFSEEAAKWEMDELRGKKNDIIKAITIDCEKFFGERGITITTIGMFGGYTYANKEIQQAIDKVFKAQMDKNVALAEVAAAKERKNAMQEAGEGEAKQKIAIAKGEAEAVQALADAKAYEVKKLLEDPTAYIALRQLDIQQKALSIWDGKYPIYLAGSGDNTPSLLLTLPRVDDLPKSKPRAKPEAKTANHADPPKVAERG